MKTQTLQINSHAMAMPVGSQWSLCQAQGQAQSRKCTREESDESCLFSSWVSVSSKVWCKMWVYVGGIVFLLRMDLYHSNIVYIYMYVYRRGIVVRNIFYQLWTTQRLTLLRLRIRIRRIRQWWGPWDFHRWWEIVVARNSAFWIFIAYHLKSYKSHR